LVRQLLERYPFLYPLVQPIYEKHRREMTKPSKVELLVLLSNICQVFETLFCAIDGLDEAAPDTQFDLLQALSSVGAQFFITSRPLQPLQSTLPSARFFTIVAHEEDIELLIRNKIDQNPAFSALLQTWGSLKTRNQIVSEVKKATGGMLVLSLVVSPAMALTRLYRFLHATLQVEALLHATNLRHALDTLDQPLPTINDAYGKTMERIAGQPGAKPQLARRLLACLAYAQRGLTTDDARFALAIQLSHPLPPNTEIVDSMLLEDETTLVSICCGLVVVDESAIRSFRLVRE
jgi:ankyrin repeat domain-containing protein 50